MKNKKDSRISLQLTSFSFCDLCIKYEATKNLSTRPKNRPKRLWYFKIFPFVIPNFVFTGKSLSEALIFAKTNPQYDARLFIELQFQYMKIPSSNLGRTCSAKRRASDKDLPVVVDSIYNVHG